MSIVEVKVPQLSESVAEATMLQWKKKAGDTVSADEILIEIETDKVVLEVPAPAAGVLSEILVADGGTGIAEQLIARIDTEGKMSVSPASAPASAASSAAKPASAPADTSKAHVAMPAAAATRESIARMVGRGHDNIDFAVLLQETAADAGLVLKSENVKMSDGLES